MTNSSQSRDPEPDVAEENTSNLENPVSIHGEFDLESQPQSPQSLDTSNIQDPEESQVLEQEDQESSGMLRPVFNPTYKKVNKRNKKSFMKLQAVNKKVQNMLNSIVLIPFEPLKTLDFSKHEGLLKRLGLWDFAHIEFDTSIKADLICQFIVSTDFTKRCCFVNGIRINVGRAYFARAFKLPLQSKKDKSVGNAANAAIDLDLVWEKMSDEVVWFVEEFVRNLVVFGGEGRIMSNEIMNWMGYIKDGHPEKVDWASLFWFMVEAELKQRDQLQTCFYASHLQYFLKSQRRDFFAEEAKEVVLGDEEMTEDGKLLMEGDKQVELVEVKKEDSLLDEANRVDEKDVEKDEKEVEKDEKEGPHSHDAEVEEMKEDKDGSFYESDKDGSFYESTKGEDNIVSEELYTELTLGHQDIVEKEETKDDDGCEEKKQGHWFLSRNDITSKHFLQPCNLGESKGFDDNDKIEQKVEHVEMEEEVEVEDEGDQMEEDDLEVDETEEVDDTEEEEEEVDEMGEHFEVEEEEEELEDEIECNISPNNCSFEGADLSHLTGDFLQGIETTQMPLNFQGQQLHENSSMELFVSNAETHLVMGGPSMFDNGHKRVVDYEQDASQLNGNKRIRTDVGWDYKTSDFGFCMGQIEQFMERAKVIHKEKEQEFHDLNMTHQYLLREVQQRDNIVETLQRTEKEELQKKDREIFRLERELCLLGELVNGYREALKENRRVFSEYRQRCQPQEEPIYKDAGPGGLVLSVTELEKQRQKKEREDMLNRLVIEQKYNEAIEGYVNQFEALLAKVKAIDFDRLTPIENEVKLLKEFYAAKCQTSEKAESKTAG